MPHQSRLPVAVDVFGGGAADRWVGVLAPLDVSVTVSVGSVLMTGLGAALASLRMASGIGVPSRSARSIHSRAALTCAEVTWMVLPHRAS